MNDQLPSGPESSANSPLLGHPPPAAPSDISDTGAPAQSGTSDESASNTPMPDGHTGTPAHTQTDAASDVEHIITRLRSTPFYALRDDRELQRELAKAFVAKAPPKEDELFRHHAQPTAIYKGATARLLSSREQEVLRCYAQGMPRMQVAEHMGLSFNTIANMRKNMLVKSRCSCMEELIQVARLEDLL